MALPNVCRLCRAVGVSSCQLLWIAVVVLVGVPSTAHGLYIFLDFVEFVSDLGVMWLCAAFSHLGYCARGFMFIRIGFEGYRWGGPFLIGCVRVHASWNRYCSADAGFDL